ncbi:MAG: flagellar basal body rod protein FlgB [Rhodobiaceae bacterium]|nr:flagellar basal body rod protein FlgB [Rhodobiaceae bacterium]
MGFFGGSQGERPVNAVKHLLNLKAENFTGSGFADSHIASHRARNGDGTVLSDFPILSNLKTKLMWHQQRQSVLAENVANADTPDYQARELKAPTFGDALDAAPVAVERTNAAHMAGTVPDSRFGVDRRTGSWEVTPEGNGVVLEEQMIKVADNQMDYQLATSLYSRAMSLLRIAATGKP